MICSQNFKGSNNEEIEFIILSKTRFDQLELHQRTDHKDTKQDYEDVEGFDSLRKTWKLWFGIIDWPLGSTLYIFHELDHVSYWNYNTCIISMGLQTRTTTFSCGGKKEDYDENLLASRPLPWVVRVYFKSESSMKGTLCSGKQQA